MLSRLRSIYKRQSGFTLIEVLVATAITGLIGAGVAGAVSHVINVNALTGNRLIVVKQVENAVHWINRDARMAQVTQTSGSAGFPVSFSWVEWDNSIHNVSYVLQDGQLHRNASVSGVEQSIMVADYMDINPDKTNCQYVNGVFTLKLTVSIGGFRPASETRTMQVISRTTP